MSNPGFSSSVRNAPGGREKTHSGLNRISATTIPLAWTHPSGSDGRLLLIAPGTYDKSDRLREHIVLRAE
jgi:hypothetical protein